MKTVVERPIAGFWNGLRRGGQRLSLEQLRASRAGLSGLRSDGHLPAGLAVGPLPGSVELVRRLSSNTAAVTPAAPAPSTGTPGAPKLFTSWPWSAVGKVLVGHTSPDGTRVQDASGTGVMVGRWLMLTAGHVVPWEYRPAATGGWSSTLPSMVTLRSSVLQTFTPGGEPRTRRRTTMTSPTSVGSTTPSAA